MINRKLLTFKTSAPSAGKGCACAVCGINDPTFAKRRANRRACTFSTSFLIGTDDCPSHYQMGTPILGNDFGKRARGKRSLARPFGYSLPHLSEFRGQQPAAQKQRALCGGALNIRNRGSPTWGRAGNPFWLRRLVLCRDPEGSHSLRRAAAAPISRTVPESKMCQRGEKKSHRRSRSFALK